MSTDLSVSKRSVSRQLFYFYATLFLLIVFLPLISVIFFLSYSRTESSFAKVRDLEQELNVKLAEIPRSLFLQVTLVPFENEEMDSKEVYSNGACRYPVRVDNPDNLNPGMSLNRSKLGLENAKIRGVVFNPHSPDSTANSMVRLVGFKKKDTDSSTTTLEFQLNVNPGKMKTELF